METPTAEAFLDLGGDLARVWDDPATDVRLKKLVLRTLIEEIVVDVDAAAKSLQEKACCPLTGGKKQI